VQIFVDRFYVPPDLASLEMSQGLLVLGDTGLRPLSRLKLVQRIVVLPAQTIALDSKNVITSPRTIPKGLEKNELPSNLLAFGRGGEGEGGQIPIEAFNATQTI